MGRFADAAGFALAKLAEMALAPSTLLLGCSALGVLLLLRRSRQRRAARAGTVLLAVAVGAQCLLALLPLDSWALAPLEDRFAPCRTPPAGLAGVIVLGGAVDTAITEARGLPTLNAAAGRMTELVRLARLLPGAVLVFTGGSGRLVGGRLTEADVARMFWDEQGLGGRHIVFEDRSRTTWENASGLRAILHPAAGAPWLLDTSAVHMPRAVAAFVAAGFSVVPDPVAYQTAPTLAAEWAPGFADRLGRLDEAAHEWTGLAAYRLLGRTRRLLPERVAACAAIKPA